MKSAHAVETLGRTLKNWSHGNSDKPLEPERYKTSKYWGDAPWVNRCEAICATYAARKPSLTTSIASMLRSAGSSLDRHEIAARPANLSE
jgi:hypothetical protein